MLRVQPRALPDALAPVSGAQQAQIQSNTVLLWLGGDRIFTGSKLSVLNRKEIWKLFYTVSLIQKKSSICYLNQKNYCSSQVRNCKSQRKCMLSFLSPDFTPPSSFSYMLSLGIPCAVLMTITQACQQQTEEAQRKYL